ncbi:MAG: hypothetical protein KME20_01025 [Kaiparowitsia implicata GSE-PSE-MK54-09C]|jgi:hypothetical protein|nr:hypothetical protein [Kaiparowitsia implicata GSE-PSE-MK54-09C]
MKFPSLLTLSSILFLLGGIPTTPALAQREICRDNDWVAPSSTLRTIELPQFGIDMDIPANYRAIAVSYGSVDIYDPGTYEIVACLNRGGEASVPRSLELFSIRRVSNPRNLTLPALIQQEEGAFQPKYRYNLAGTTVFVMQPLGFGVTAWFTPRGARDAIVMYDTCDCDPRDSDLFNRLNHTRFR